MVLLLSISSKERETMYDPYHYGKVTELINYVQNNTRKMFSHNTLQESSPPQKKSSESVGLRLCLRHSATIPCATQSFYTEEFPAVLLHMQEIKILSIFYITINYPLMIDK